MRLKLRKIYKFCFLAQPDTSADSAIVSTADSTSINIAPHQVDLTTPQHVL